MYGKKGSHLSYNASWESRRKKGREKFISKMNKEFPGKLDKFPKDNYLWMYMVGKYMLLRYPALGDQLNIYTSEDDPLRTIAEANWETDPTCKALTSKQSTKITKLDNGLWKKCPIEIVPV